jgi:hypothetical protein
MKNVYKILVENSEGNRPLVRCRWEIIFLINLSKIGLEDVDWIHLAQSRDWWQILVNMVMNLWVP